VWTPAHQCLGRNVSENCASLAGPAFPTNVTKQGVGGYRRKDTVMAMTEAALVARQQPLSAAIASLIDPLFARCRASPDPPQPEDGLAFPLGNFPMMWAAKNIIYSYFLRIINAPAATVDSRAWPGGEENSA
jgi:hypothetical protein